jgi:hypothetical protein
MSYIKAIFASPKYPIDQNYCGPHFLVFDETEEKWIEAWWMFPHPDSQNYRNNASPSLVTIINDAIINVKAYKWAPLPTNEV